jgi:outer membrane lipoprotein-sorting protein
MVSIRSDLAHGSLAALLGLVRCRLWVAFCAAALVAQAAESTDVLDRWLAAQTSLGPWTANFIQTRTLKVLSEPLVSTGQVWVAGSSQFRWELGQPPQTVVVRQPDQLLVMYPRLKRVEKYALSGVAAGPLRDALSLLDASFPRDRATVESRFRLQSAVETNSVLEVTLQPKSASARKLVSEILIGLRTNDFSMASTEMRFADGSRLRNDFINVAVRQSLAADRFTLQTPADYAVVEPLRP